MCHQYDYCLVKFRKLNLFVLGLWERLVQRNQSWFLVVWAMSSVIVFFLVRTTQESRKLTGKSLFVPVCQVTLKLHSLATMSKWRSSWELGIITRLWKLSITHCNTTLPVGGGEGTWHTSYDASRRFLILSFYTFSVPSWRPCWRW